MRKSILNKDIWLSFRQSRGRFISIMSLMMLGAFALVGLKTSGPDIERSASRYLASLNTMDLALISDYGISKEDQKELDGIDGAQVEYGYFTDVVIGESYQALRVFSKPDNISKFKLVSGKYPRNDREIALLSSFQDRYKIGDKLTVNEKSGGNQLLTQHGFTITGFVNSGELGSTVNFGNTNVGNGTLSGYALVLPQAFDSQVYTLARLTYKDLKGLNSFGLNYRTKLEKYQKDLEKLVADNAENRLEEIQSAARKKIQDGEADLQKAQQSLIDAENQLVDGQNQINQQQTDLNKAQSQIAENEGKLSQAATQLAEAEQVLAASKAQLDAVAPQIAAGQNQLNQNKAQLDAALASLMAAQQILEGKRADLDTAQASLSQGQAELEAAKSQLQAQLAAIEAQGGNPADFPKIAAAQQEIATKETELATAQQALEAGNVQYQTALTTYQAQEASYQSGLSQYQEAVAQFESKKTAYNVGLNQYQTGLASLESKKAEYQSGVNQLAQAKEQLAAGQQQIDQAQASLDEKKAEFAQQKGEAENKIKTGQVEIQKAKEEAAGLSLPSYHVYTRRNFPGDTEYQITATRASGMSSVGNVFPIVLYLVAALVTMTTMTRFVSEERMNAGILRALGYENRDVIKKFVVYGLIAGVLGTIFGILAGTYFLPYILGKSLFKTSTYPAIRLDFYWQISLVALVLSFICSVVPALYIAHKELKEKPAQLLLPKPPSKGSSILLEKIGFIWRCLSFAQKVTARNIFRYKLRMFMTIFGVAGSVALLFAGLGISSSLGGIAERQFGEIFQYDMIVVEKNRSSQAEEQDLIQALKSDKVSGSQGIYRETFTKTIKGLKDEQSIAMFVSKNNDFKGFMELYDSQSGQKLTLSDNGIVLSRKLATVLNVSVGDSIELTSDEGKAYKLKVSGISEMYAGHFIFLNQTYYEKVFARDFAINAYLVKLKNPSSKNIQARAADFMKETGVQTVVQDIEVIESINAAVKSLGLVMQILTLVSILLAVVILYNLTTINVSERIRELSTIKVLGFHNKEVTLYIYRETIVLSLIGIVVGIFAGKTLHSFLLQMIAPDNVLFNPEVSFTVYLIPVISIMGILILLGYMVNYNLRRVDMLEALKSVD